MNREEITQRIIKLKMGTQTQEVKEQIQKLQQSLDEIVDTKG